MKEKPEEEKILIIAAIRKLKTKQLSDWEKDFIRNVEARIQRGELTEKQKAWLSELRKKYLQKK